MAMSSGEVVLMTDFGSQEDSRPKLAAAVELLTGTPPVVVDARHFMTGGGGRATLVGRRLTLEVPSDSLTVTPGVVVVYEIPPTERRRFERFLRTLHLADVVSLNADPDAWRTATEKDRTVRRFLRDGIRHMETISLSRPSAASAVEAFERLDRDVWARPVIGVGGQDVFHVTTQRQLLDALRHFASSEQDWLLSRDALNFNEDGLRHQFRVIVLDDRVLRVCEHVQADPDAPCNEVRGAVSTVTPEGGVLPDLLRLAVAATRSLGLHLGGVDLALENGGVVFEVNVHPVLARTGDWRRWPYPS
jgi:glutathione synthase/RimK-type ligase-like ATP-grasp enzyme